MMTRTSVQASFHYLVIPSAAAFLLLELALFLLTRIATLLSVLAFGLLTLLVAGGFAFELLAWQAQGIRSLELDSETLTLYCGPVLAPRKVERQSVRSVRLREGLGRRTVELVLSSGKRLRIRSDAFPPEPFERFCASLMEWQA
jgi:hypothetical protein